MLATLTLTALTASLVTGEVPGPKATKPSATVSPGVDPLLPAELRGVVEEASRVELDPKRGTNNAVALLRAKKAELAGKQGLAMSLDLRIAAATLRQRFLTATEFPPARRAEQALSTFSRLDLLEPGLEPWLERALDASPAVKKKLGKRGTWTMRVAVVSHSASVDRQAAFGAFAAAFQKVGVRLESVPVKEAPMVIALGAEDAAKETGRARAVKVTLGLESIRDGKVAWKTGLFRIEAAEDPKAALASALDWLVRIGGRDLFFRWLSEEGLTGLANPTPGRGGGEHVHAGRPSGH